MKPPKGVPRDEWLLAIGLAAQPASDDAVVLARVIDPEGVWIAGDGSDCSAAFNGAAFDFYDDDEGNPDAYAAGAALAMALESK